MLDPLEASNHVLNASLKRHSTENKTIWHKIEYYSPTKTNIQTFGIQRQNLDRIIAYKKYNQTLTTGSPPNPMVCLQY